MNIENKVFGILLEHPEKQNFILNSLDASFFEDSTISLMFNEAKKIHDKGQIVDATLLNESLQDIRVAEKLADIIFDFSYSFQAKDYCQTLFNRYLKRRIEESTNEDDLKQLAILKEKYSFDDDILHISSNIRDFEKRYSERRETAIYTYYSLLDDVIGSFNGGDYIALGAATGMGKTALALNLTRQVCMQDKHVLYFSLEMPLEQLQNRFVCMNEGLSASKFRSCGFNLVEMTKYKQGLENLVQWNLNIVSDYNLTPEKMKNYIQKQKHKGLDFVILDYLGLMRGYENKTTYERISLLSREMKLIAGEFNVPILVLLQLNRDLKAREDKRPKLSDIRDSGAIEQDSDFVLFAHREGYYDPDKPQNELEIIIAKNRHGANNRIIRLYFDLQTQLIKEIY